MASVITYNQVIDLLIDITKRHEQVNTFFLGRNWETENSEDILFPLFQVYPDFGKLTANSFNEYKTQTIRFVCKMLDLTTNGEENKRDVHSDTLRYAQDIVNEFNQHPFYMRSNIKLIGDVDFNEVLQEYQDDVTAGWEFNLTFQLININQFCGMPIQDIPGYSATGPESTGTIVNVQYLTCATLPNCSTIIDIEADLIDLQEQIDNLPPSALTLEQVLTYGNTTGNINIASPNLNNILQVSDTVMGLSWNGVVGGNLTLDDTIGTLYHDTLTQIESQNEVKVISANSDITLNSTFIKLAHDTFVTIDTIQTLILGEFHHILTGVNTITRIDTVPDSVLLSVQRVSDGYDNQVYVERYLTGINATAVSGIVSKLEIHTTQQPLLTGDTSLDNTMIITDNISNKGLVYVADYSANFTDNSLVTKAWVLAQTPAAPTLADVLAVGNNNNNIDIRSLNTFSVLTVIDNYVGLEWNDGASSYGIFGADSNTTHMIHSSAISNSYVTLSDASANISHDVLITLNSPITTITSNQISLTSTDNASVNIISPAGFYYPALNFFNNGTNLIGSITGYGGALFIGGVGGTPLIVTGGGNIINLETANTLTYLDSNKYLKSATIGTGLTFSGGTLSISSTYQSTRSVTSVTTATTSIIPLGVNNINYSITALASALTIQTSGLAQDFDKILIRIKDDGTARALTFDPVFFEAKGMALPTTTVLGKVITIGFIFDSVTNKYGCVSVAQEI